MNILSKRGFSLTAAGVLAVAGLAVTTQQALAAPTALRTCQAADLYLSMGRVSPGAGQLYVPVVLTNTSTSSCALRGYPGVSLVNLAHAEVAPAATHNGQSVVTVTIRPGGSASAALHTTNGPIGGSCSSASAYVRVYPPASRQSVQIPYALRDCSHVFTVGPVHAGTTG